MILQYSIISAILGFGCILYIRSYDIWEPESLLKLILTTIFGGFISILIALCLYRIIALFTTVDHTLLSAFIFIGPIEEISKLLAFVILYAAVIRKEIDEPIDAIVYMSCIALGFSAIENVKYAINGGGSIIGFRYAIATPAHILFALPMAIPLCGVLQNKKSKLSTISYIISSIFLHGLWDAIAFNSSYLKVFTSFIALMLLYAKSTISKSLLASQYYPSINMFFVSGNAIKHDKKVYCAICCVERMLSGNRNGPITYFKCKTCKAIIIDRNNCFMIIHHFFATTNDLSKEYVDSLRDPSMKTIRECIYINEEMKWGYLNISQLKKQVSIARGSARTV